MYARTGKDHWIVTKQEKEMLGRRGKRAFDLFVKINPAWLTAGLLVTGMGAVYGPRFAADAKERKEQKTEHRSTEQKTESKKV